MKILRRILMVVVVLVVLIAVISFILPTEYTVVRTISIKAPATVVEKQVKYYESFKEWNPFADADTAMATTIEGKDGELGAVYKWNGNDEVGSGEMEVTAISENRIDQKLHFISPFEGFGAAWYEWSNANDSTSLTWGMKSEMKRPMNIMSLFMDMDEMIGTSYETGLGRVKERAEAMTTATNFRGFDVKEIEMSPRVYIAVKDTVKFQDMEAFYAKSFGAVMGAMAKKKIQVAGPTSAVFFVWDEANAQAVMAAGAPAKDGSKIDGFESIPAGGKALQIAYYGAYAGSANAHWAMDDYITSRGVESGLVIEEYVTNPMTEKDTAKWLTNIYYILK
jgi:effector-binding domain-containing protein